MQRIVTLLSLGLLLLVNNVQADVTAQDIAEAYGIKNWGDIVELRFTFNVKTPDREAHRHWTWRPHDDRITLKTDGEEPISYSRSSLTDNTPQAIISADKRFINDSYWFLFPFQVVWSNPTVTDAGIAELPIGEGRARKVIVQYPDEGGYTPGDAYDLYLNDQHHIVQWVFRRGGGENGRAMTWENVVDLGPIRVCTDHYNADRTFRLWFSGVSVVTKDGDAFSLPDPEDN